MRIRTSLFLFVTAMMFMFAIWVMYLMVSIYQYSLDSDDVQADAAIVLGAAVWQDEPSPVFEARIKHGINLYQNEKVKYLIFTGGVGDDDNLAESLVARIYAVNAGVPNEVIFAESSSRITLENLSGAKKIMDEKGIKTVLIVSDPLHMKRSVTMAHDLGMLAYSSPTPNSRYKTWKSKSKLITSETYYYIGHMFRKLFIW